MKHIVKFVLFLTLCPPFFAHAEKEDILVTRGWMPNLEIIGDWRVRSSQRYSEKLKSYGLPEPSYTLSHLKKAQKFRNLPWKEGELDVLLAFADADGEMKLPKVRTKTDSDGKLTVVALDVSGRVTADKSSPDGPELRSGTGPAVSNRALLELKKLSNLEVLFIVDTVIGDDAVSVIASFPNLKGLWVSSIFTQDGVNRLAAAKKLEWLCLFGTGIRNLSLRDWEGHDNLQCLELDASYGQETPEDRKRILAEAKLIPNLKYLFFYDLNVLDDAERNKYEEELREDEKARSVENSELTVRDKYILPPSRIPANQAFRELEESNWLPNVHVYTPEDELIAQRRLERSTGKDGPHPDAVEQITFFYKEIEAIRSLPQKELNAIPTVRNRHKKNRIKIGRDSHGKPTITAIIFDDVYNSFTYPDRRDPKPLVDNDAISKFSDMPNLEAVLIFNTLVNDDAATLLASLPKLRALWVSSFFTERGFKELAAAKKLEWLYLIGSNIKNPSLLDWKDQGSLKTLYLPENDEIRAQKGRLIEEAKQLPNLKALYLGGVNLLEEAKADED